MQIKNLRLNSFGKFKDFELEFKSGLNIIRADNEFGKTTICSALDTLYNGFKPANKNFKYIPYGSEKASLSMTLKIASLDILVERTTTNKGKGKITAKSGIHSFKNEALCDLGEFVNLANTADDGNLANLPSLTKSLLDKQLWYFDHSQFVKNFSGDKWDTWQELVNTMSVQDEALEFANAQIAIDNELKNLYTNNANSQSEIACVQRQITNVQLEYENAKKTYSDLCVYYDDLSQLNAQRTQIQADIKYLETMGKVLDFIYSYKEIKAKYDLARNEYENQSIAQKINSNALMELEQIAINIQNSNLKLSKLQMHLQNLGNTMEKCQKDSIYKFQTLNQNNTSELERIHFRLAKFKDDLQKNITNSQNLDKIDSLESQRDKLLTSGKDSAKKELTICTVLVFLAILIANMAVFLGKNTGQMLVIMLVLSFVALVLGVFYGVKARGKSGEIRKIQEQIQRIENELQFLNSNVKRQMQVEDRQLYDAILNDLQTNTSLVAKVDLDTNACMYEKILKFASVLDDVNNELMVFEEISHTQIAQIKDKHKEIFETTCINILYSSVFSNTQNLICQISELEEIITNLTVQIRGENSLINDEMNKLSDLELKKTQIESEIEQIYGTDVQNARQIRENALKIASNLEIYHKKMSEIEKSQEYKKCLESEYAKYLNDDFDVDKIAQKVHECKAKYQAMNIEFNQIIKRIGQCEQALLSTEFKPLENYQQELETLNQKLRTLHIRHQNLHLVKLVINTMKKISYNEHRPTFEIKLNQYIDKIFGKDYIKFLVQPDGTLKHNLVGVIEDTRIENFSTGTLSQLYFLWKLAILDDYDEFGQMPLVIDGAFGHYDDLRTDRMYEILEGIAKERQVIVFTPRCDFKMDWCITRNANVVDLG